MDSKPEVLRTLNSVLEGELTLINQYFLHARMLKNWGHKELAEKIYHQSITAMKNADAIIQRVFFLEGLPNLQKLGKLFIGENIPELLRCDLQATTAQYHLQKDAIALFEREEDFVSRALIEKLLKRSEDYIDFIGDELDLLASLGEENYYQRVTYEIAD